MQEQQREPHLEPDDASGTLADRRGSSAGAEPTLKGAPDRLGKPIRLEFNVVAALLENLAKATLFGLIPGTAAIVVTVGFWALSALPPIRDAESRTFNAEHAYHAALHDSQPVLAELALLDAPVGEIEVVYFAFADATREQKRPMADVYLGVLTDQLLAVSDDQPVDELRTLLTPANTTRYEAASAYLAWTGLLGEGRGWLLLTLRVVNPPPSTMAIYARAHPR